MRPTSMILFDLHAMKTRFFILLSLLLSSMQAAGSPDAEPEAVGFSGPRLARISELVEREVAAR